MSIQKPLRLSVVVATYNRRELLSRLLRQLAGQTLSPKDFEVVVVDDGSKEPVKPSLEALRLPYALTVHRAEKSGGSRRAPPGGPGGQGRDPPHHRR